MYIFSVVMLLVSLWFIFRGIRTACCKNNRPSQAPIYYPPVHSRDERYHRYASGQA